MNCLIDIRKIERILIIPTNREIGRLTTANECEKPPEVSTLEEELIEYKLGLEKMKKDFLEVENAYNEDKLVREEEQKIYEQKKNDFDQKIDNVDPMKERLSEIEKEMNRHEREKKMMEIKLNNYKERRGQYVEEEKRKRDKYEEVLKAAKRRSENEVEVTKSAEEIHKELMIIQESLQRDQEGLEELLQEAVSWDFCCVNKLGFDFLRHTVFNVVFWVI